MKNTNTFVRLVTSIKDIDTKLALQASKAVNVSLTLRNWIIGCYIAEYEFKGADRAKYGESLLTSLEVELERLAVKNCARRQLYNYLKFYRTYPEIVRSVSAQLADIMPAKNRPLPVKVPTVSAQLTTHRNKLINSLSYSMFKLLVEIEDDTKRVFYEIECIRGGWSVRELERQIYSFYYERMGLSKNKDKLSKMANAKAEIAEPKLNIRDPYIFEFLGLKPKEVMAESRLEDGLLDKLQEFLLEMGHGFCFEARQKKILIGESNYFIDLVFYHRVLKCHVLVELKTGVFTHENIGQMNTYVSWYKKNMMEKGDNSPVGIFLCTNRDQALVEYALAGMANKLFVSKYQLELPKKEEIQRYMRKQIQDSV